MLWMNKNRHEVNLGKFKKICEFLVLFAIVLLGFVLRFYKVGRDSFWLDEAGQASAAIQPHLIDTLMIVRQHAGAMPLDYLVSRIMASISLDEKVMRLPSVLWGTFSIIAYFLLIRELDLPHKKLMAFLSALLLAISPFYIQYSQEMRFYAALVFFYIASTLLLFRAFKESSTRNWLIYILITAIGIYFHPYVLFTIITGFIFILGELGGVGQYLSNNKGNILKFIVSSILIVAIYTPGYIFFTTKQSFSSDLGFNLTTVLKGLGLTAIRGGADLEPLGLWHIMLIIGAVCGLFLIVTKHKEYRLALYLLVAFFLQFCLIVWLDAYKHYFFAARQIIHLALIVLLLTSIFVVHFLSAIQSSYIKYIFFFAVIGIICASALPYIKAVYAYSKGNAGEIVQAIISDYQPKEKVLILSSDYKFVLDYYFLRFEKPNSPTPITLLANNINELRELIRETPDVYFVVAPKNTTGDIRSLIASLGYKIHRTKSNVDFLFFHSQ